MQAQHNSEALETGVSLIIRDILMEEESEQFSSFASEKGIHELQYMIYGLMNRQS